MDVKSIGNQMRLKAAPLPVAVQFAQNIVQKQNRRLAPNAAHKRKLAQFKAQRCRALLSLGTENADVAPVEQNADVVPVRPLGCAAAADILRPCLAECVPECGARAVALEGTEGL